MRMTRAAYRFRSTRAVASGLVLVMAASVAWGLQAMPRGQRHESRREIDQLEQTWRQAVLHRDTQTMNRLLAEDFLSIAPNGLLQTKAETLAAMRNGSTVFHSIDILDQRVRFYGETAVVTSKARVMATTPDGDLMGNYRYTRVYARDRKGTWRIVSFEASRIRQGAQHH